MSVKRGDIYYADLSPVVGSEQGGLRPVLIIQNDVGNRYSPTVIAAAITSRLGKTRLPTHIDVFADRVGLVKDSVILLEQVEHEAMTKTPVVAAPKPKKEKPKGGTKDQDKLVRRLEREIEKQEKIIGEFDPKIEAASADYQELTRLLEEKEAAEALLMDLMEQWESAQE